MHASLAVADHFTSALAVTFETLERMPEMGARCGFKKSSTKGMRRWPVPDFENWLIFYLPKTTGVEIIRVIHGARDIEVILG